MRILAAFLLLLQVTPVAAQTTLVLDDADLRVRDIAITKEGGDAILLRLAPGTRAVELGEDKRRQLVRNRLPGLLFELRHAGDLLVARGLGNERRQTCLVTRRKIASGTYLLRDDVAPGPCGDSRTKPALAYDRAATAVYARADIPAGTSIGNVSLPQAAPLAADSAVMLEFAEGPVVIQREVHTLQSSRPGCAVFVRTEDGEVLSATVVEKQEIAP